MTGIRFEDVRVGDRVRWTKDYGDGAVKTVVGIVKDVDLGAGITCIHIRNFGSIWPEDPDTIELLSRPVPPAKCGDIREDPETGARYVRTDDSTPIQWVLFTRRSDPRARDFYLSGARAEIIARLVPVEQP